MYEPVSEDIDICPACGDCTDSLKRYTFPRIGFAFVAISIQDVGITACPQCMRRFIVHWSLVSLLLTNVLWPFVVLPLLIARLPSSFRRGPNLAEKPWPKKIAGDIAHAGMLAAVLAIIVASLYLAFGAFPPKSMLYTMFGVGIGALALCGAIGYLADI